MWRECYITVRWFQGGSFTSFPPIQSFLASLIFPTELNKFFVFLYSPGDIHFRILFFYHWFRVAFKVVVIRCHFDQFLYLFQSSSPEETLQRRSITNFGTKQLDGRLHTLLCIDQFNRLPQLNVSDCSTLYWSLKLKKPAGTGFNSWLVLSIVLGLNYLDIRCT